MSYIDEVEAVLARDLATIREKDKQYGGSWQKRGGVGAFMMLCRKWDRVETHLEQSRQKWDIFQAALEDRRQEGILDDIGDLRRYLALVEAEVVCLRQNYLPPEPGYDLSSLGSPGKPPPLPASETLAAKLCEECGKTEHLGWCSKFRHPPVTA